MDVIRKLILILFAAIPVAGYTQDFSDQELAYMYSHYQQLGRELKPETFFAAIAKNDTIGFIATENIYDIGVVCYSNYRIMDTHLILKFQENAAPASEQDRRNLFRTMYRTTRLKPYRDAYSGRRWGGSGDGNIQLYIRSADGLRHIPLHQATALDIYKRYLSRCPQQPEQKPMK